MVFWAVEYQLVSKNSKKLVKSVKYVERKKKCCSEKVRMISDFRVMTGIINRSS